ncbi:MAG: LLM class flavin-dependent oxidoreductase, partial [bacterium]
LTPWLWTGAVRSHGAPAIAMVGTPEEIASALMEYRSIGVSQFILSGWPKIEEMIYFGREVIPRVRKIEQGHEAAVYRRGKFTK